MKQSFIKPMIVAALAVVAMAVNAAPVGVAAARSSAMQALMSQREHKLMQVSPELELAYTEVSSIDAALADFYVFNSSDGAAFVIVAGDDRAQEILGYGNGTLDMNSLPCNLQWMLGAYKEQMEWLVANPKASVAKTASRRAGAEELVIMPMLTCQWNQDSPYNDRCPEVQGEKCPTGCIATAMAQVLYYWKYPEKCPDLDGYVTTSRHISMPPLPEVPIHWDNILDYYEADATEDQCAEIAQLMLYCGQSCNMDYDNDGSGAYVEEQLDGLMKFGFNPGANVYYKASADNSSWENMIIDDLLNGSPVLYSGYTTSTAGGHAFVLDGYYMGKFHINWGWGGTGNGYFALGAFNVEGTSYNYRQIMIHGLSAPDGPECYDFEADGIYYKRDEDVRGVVVCNKDSKYNSYSGEVIVPAQVTHDGVTMDVMAVGKNAFRGCSDLTRVVLPSSVTMIDDYAFMGCYKLAEVVMSDQVTSIGDQAFNSCFALQGITMPRDLRHVGRLAFKDCSSLQHVEAADMESWLRIDFASHDSNPLTYAHHLHVGGEEVKQVVVPASIGGINDFAFIEATALESVTIEEGVERIGTAAFAYCTGITRMEMPQSLKDMGKQTFFGCDGLEHLVVPSQVTTIGYATFGECNHLASLEFPASLKAIDDYAFYGCKALKNLSLPDSVTSIGYASFYICSGLESADLSDSIRTIGDYAFAGCQSLKTLSLPASLQAIGSAVFSSCLALNAVTIPDQVTRVGIQAFYQCEALQDVTFGSSVMVIDQQAFFQCNNVRTIICKPTTPPIISNRNCFTNNVYSNATVYVPEAQVSAYKDALNWKRFNIEAIPVTVTPGDLNADSEVNIADVNLLIAAILYGESAGTIYDVNGDGEVSIADVNALIDLIMGN